MCMLKADHKVLLKYLLKAMQKLLKKEVGEVVGVEIQYGSKLDLIWYGSKSTSSQQ
jgi:hypothetical protein